MGILEEDNEQQHESKQQQNVEQKRNEKMLLEDCGICTIIRKEGATIRDGPDIDNSNVIGRFLILNFIFITNLINLFLDFYMVNNFILLQLKLFHHQTKNV